MRSATKWMAAVSAILLVAGSALAQPPQRGQRQGGGGFGGNRAAPATLLANEDVQKELKLTDEQKEAVKKFAPQQGRRPGGDGQGGGGQGGNRQRGQGGQGGQRGQGGQANSESAQAAEKFVKESLNADQQKRFKQIRVQVMGVQAFADEDVQSALKLTDEQKAKVKTLVEDFNKDSRELMGAGRGQGAGGAGGAGGNVNIQEITQKRQALTKDYMEKAQGALTADQKKAWKDYIGTTFTLQQRRPVPADR